MKSHRPRSYQTNVLHQAGKLVVLPMIILLSSLAAYAQEINTTLPAPMVNEPIQSHHEIIVLSGGCFWGIQGVFQHVKGVTRAVSGYSGGQPSTARYETVTSGNTGHAESVKIEFDPHLVSLGELLRIYFSVAHDPTELNYQGPDHGTQYRSAIWATNAEQQKVATSYVAQLDRAGIFSAKIVTQINPLKGFYPAEDYHQDYLTLHPENPYIARNDLPKIANLKRLYPANFNTEPVLVNVH